MQRDTIVKNSIKFTVPKMPVAIPKKNSFFPYSKHQKTQFWQEKSPSAEKPKRRVFKFTKPKTLKGEEAPFD